MAEVVANLRLEYGPNTLTFYKTDELGDPESFSTDIDNLSFKVQRIDNSSVNYNADITDISAAGDLSKIEVALDFSDKYLYKSGDNIYTPSMHEYNHIYSLIDKDVAVRLTGKVQIFEVAN